ncbi:MAG TPA: DNA gyrase inhibitor YacG [Verrucomicrobiae bacterium]
MSWKFGPFCSERCKLVDLGKWFAGEHAISEPLRPEHFEKFADLPAGVDLEKPEAD